MYEVRTEQFKGPLEKLLELIEEKKMEITELNIGLVTDDFIKYLKTIKVGEEKKTEEEIRLIADFVVIASRLILIKSKALLPSLKLTAEEETEIKELERRLVFYQQFKPAMVHFKKLFNQKRFSASRPLFFNRPPIFSPPKNLSVALMKKTIKLISETVKKLSLEIQIIEKSLIKIEEKIEEILDKIKAGISQFGHLIKEKSKKEIVVMFLALLHLLREQTIEVEQKKGFSEITIKKRGGENNK